MEEAIKNNLHKRKLEGVVVSNKMMKTVVVEVSGTRLSPKYQKFFKIRSRFKAHTEVDYKVGDKVIIEETRPISKDKRWVVISKIN